ncbi:MAG: ABC transporter ATP-binding protein [Desulfomonilaceae bacterium]
MRKDRKLLYLFKTLVRAYPRESAVVTLTLFLAGLAEGFGIATLLPLLGLVAGGESRNNSELGRMIADALQTVGVQPTVGMLIALMLVLMTAKTGLFLLAARQWGLYAGRVETDLRMDFIRALMRARWEYFISQRQGSLANSITTEARNASDTYVLGCRIIAAGLQAVMYIAVALLVSWKVTVGALIGGALTLSLLNGFVTMARRAGEQQTALLKEVSARLLDGVQGIKPLKAMACEERLVPLLEKDMHNLYDARRKEVLSGEGLNTLSEFALICLVAVGILVAFTVWGAPLETVMLFAVLAWRTFGKMRIVQQNYQWLRRMESSFWSLRSAIDQATAANEPALNAKTPTLNRAITFRNVSFSYGDKPVLTNVFLTIPSGSFIALTGPSGAGKTTIADLIIGLFRPQSGQVCIDDVPVADLSLKTWRSMVGYAPQETIMFHDTIFTNVTLGDSALSRADAKEALRAAGSWDFVSSLAGGMDWVVGEKGARLSGGQRQRIAIARALIRRPQLLILDEATTALDPKTEATVCKTLEQLRGNITIIAISHQPALVNAADEVYRLDHQTLTREPLRAVQAMVGMSAQLQTE